MPMRVVVTGASGFIATNLQLRLREVGHEPVGVSHDMSGDALAAALTGADFVFHLAGVNRPRTVDEFASGNVGFTQTLLQAMRAAGTRVPLAYASSTQAALDNPYGRSKRAAEDDIRAYGRETGAPVAIFRLPNVFGKWARPNYNSAVATFCHNIARGLPITVNDPAAPLSLVYVDDVCDAFVRLLDAPAAEIAGRADVEPVYRTTVGEVADTIRGFPQSRASLVTPPVGTGLVRALYATYLSYLSTEAFAYEVPRYSDPRGTFAEVLKTPDCGQFSYFTSKPGITRGEHYHHTKVEKFIVVSGSARFGFRHVGTGETCHLDVAAGDGRIVETVPGWAHNVTNIGDDELVVMLWANEIFDRDRPDTVSMKVSE